MRKKLALIAVAGFAVSAICLTGAFALGNGLSHDDFDFGSLPECPASDGGATATSRTLAWNDGDARAAVALPANSHWQAGSGDALVVKGDPAIISHIRIKDGVVSLDCRNGFFRSSTNDRVDVTLPGRNFHAFAVMGSGALNLSGVNQPDVKISLLGSGDIQASGKTDKLKAIILGSGRLRLGALTAQDADTNISGSGNIEVAPQDSLSADISGSGDIDLKNEPKNIETSIHGSGRIYHPDGSSEAMARGHHASWDFDEGRFERKAQENTQKALEKYQP